MESTEAARAQIEANGMGERLPCMSLDPETANEEDYRLQVMKTSLRDQKYSFLRLQVTLLLGQ
jgi:hypothetical protein